ncbi:hypothetical protein DUI87_11862 [Hirundo rustica rustica]|uniref:Uncharacterized protein n=1 Tax=Hirundo rustica rustica TaxID=333673 RepID=A0A3M0KEX5_HIRRU|nr:hypothetical protein DUI87_11862 [Hirundo rustica rustica]
MEAMKQADPLERSKELRLRDGTRGTSLTNKFGKAPEEDHVYNREGGGFFDKEKLKIKFQTEPLRLSISHDKFSQTRKYEVQTECKITVAFHAFSVVDIFSECILFEVIDHSGCQKSLLKCLVGQCPSAVEKATLDFAC